MNALTYAGRYKATGETGSGGAGSICFCDDLHLNRPVAIKFLQAHIDKKRIYDEISALQRIRSKHVVQIYDLVIHQPGNQVGIVEERISGRDLAEVRANGAFTTDFFIRTLYQISCGLADIHEQSLIHRDVKPHNMKIDDEGLLKIFDFGLAREEGDKAYTFGFIGTPGYAAPELWNSGTVYFSSAVDVYAFGVTAAYLCDGEIPKLLLPQTFGSPPRPQDWLATGGFRTLALAVQSGFADLLNSCLDVDLKKRPSMAEVRDHLAKGFLRGRHRALLTTRNGSHVVDYQNPSAQVSSGTHSLTVTYDGYHFRVAAVTGSAYLNNRMPIVGSAIDGSCVLSLGLNTNFRLFVTVDISHPEVVL